MSEILHNLEAIEIERGSLRLSRGLSAEEAETNGTNGRSAGQPD